jgi:hypothetical protein
VTLAHKLVEALPGMARKNALLAWFMQFGKFGYDEDTRMLTFDKAASTRLGAAMETPFWQYKPEPEFRPLDLPQEIMRLIGRIDKAHESGDKRHVLPKDVEANLRMLAAPYIVEAANAKAAPKPGKAAKGETVANAAVKAKIVSKAKQDGQLATAH